MSSYSSRTQQPFRNWKRSNFLFWRARKKVEMLKERKKYEIILVFNQQWRKVVAYYFVVCTIHRRDKWPHAALRTTSVARQGQVVTTSNRRLCQRFPYNFFFHFAFFSAPPVTSWLLLLERLLKVSRGICR